MGNRGKSTGKRGIRSLPSIQPPDGSTVQPDEQVKAKQTPRKRGHRKPELRDVLTQAKLRQDVEQLRATIADGSHKERIEAFRLLYGSAGDARRGPTGQPPSAGKRPGISLPDV